MADDREYLSARSDRDSAPYFSHARLTKFSKQIGWLLFVSIGVLLAVMLAILPNLVASSIKQKPSTVEKSGEPQFFYQSVDYSQMQGWDKAELAPSLAVFLRSCAVINKEPGDAPANSIESLGPYVQFSSLAGKVSDWQAVCVKARDLSETIKLSEEDQNDIVRRFYEDNFAPIKIINRYAVINISQENNADNEPHFVDEGHGAFTGYFEWRSRASRTKTDIFSTPLYARPHDLIELDLGQFRDALAGQRLAGRLKNNRLVPYESRAQINQQGLGDRADTIAYMDPDDAFFLHIQGSGTLVFDDGEAVRVGFAGQNGHPYRAIGRDLIEQNLVPREKMSMAAIYSWLKQASPHEARAMREKNASYIFYRRLDNLPDENLGPLGAQGVQLTAQRSLAADRRYHAMGTPSWIDVTDKNTGEVFRQLMIIQDTGGAIRGPVRGDVYWGGNEDARARAGRMNASGSLIVLIPRMITQKINVSSVLIDQG